MTGLAPEKRAELRAAVEERHLFRFATERGSDGYPSSGLLEISREVRALLDAADRLTAAVERVRALHVPERWYSDYCDCDGDCERGVVEIGVGEFYHTDTYDLVCEVCSGGDLSEVPYDEPEPHPCATLRALDGTDE